MIYAEYLCIPVRVGVYICVVFMSEDHDKGVTVSVDRILGATHIICCVIDSKDVMAIHAIAEQYNLLSICIGKCVFIAIVGNILVAGQ
jgi:hypothetical protein